MKKLSPLLIYIFIADILIMLPGIVNIISIKDKPSEPEIFSKLKSNEVYVLSNGKFVLNSDKIPEAMLDTYKAGDCTKLEIIHQNPSKNYHICFRSEYDNLFIAITFLVMLFFLLPAFFILYKLQTNEISVVFNLLMISVIGILLFTDNSIAENNKYFSFLIRTLDLMSYISLSISFIHFSLLFADNKLQLKKFKLKKIYLPAFSISLLLAVPAYLYIFQTSTETIFLYEFIHFYLIRPIFILSFLIVIVIAISSYFKTVNQIEKQRLLWILLSIFWGPGIYIFLFVLPFLIFHKTFIDEATMQVLIIVSPVSLFIGIYKYNLFDIRLILKRSFLYSFTFIIILTVYISFYLFLSGIILIEKFHIQVSGIMTILLTIVIYNPVTNRLHTFLDKKIFKISYDYPSEKINFEEKIKQCMTVDDITKLLKNVFDFQIKVNEYQITIYDRLVENFSNLLNTNINLDSYQFYNLKQFITSNPYIQIIADKDFFSDNIIFHENHELMKLINADIIYCSEPKNNENQYILILGNKKDGSYYTYEDIEFLKHIVNIAEISINRINLHKKLYFQNEEIKKLEEINNLKNFFISNVSHELKTPLTSISLFSEIMLESNNISEKNRIEYLKIINGECLRLTRLINNLLDFSKIEKGIKDYDFQIADLNCIVNNVVNSMKYLINKKNFELVFSNNSSAYLILCDEDSLKEVFYNLIDNSLKYSPNNKFLSIRTFSSREFYFFEIIDKGIGIKEEYQNLIYDAYFRIKTKDTEGIAGTGIGLSIVMNILKAHKVEIMLESKYNEGTKITLKFPVTQ